MKKLNSWRYLTVLEYLERYNWSGQPSPQPDSGPSSEVSESILWHRQTVQTFLRQLNWTGHLAQKKTITSALPSFSTRLSVEDFFQFFTWEGQPNNTAMSHITQSFPVTVEEYHALES